MRASFAKGQSFADFILAHPPFPFIRPFVRAFLFNLRIFGSDDFANQVWAVISDRNIAYHIRRLVVESLSEMDPTEKDWPLIRRIFHHQSDLFNRLLIRVQDESWFSLLFDKWLPMVLNRVESVRARKGITPLSGM